MNNKILLSVVLVIFLMVVKAEEIITDPTLLYQLPIANNSVLDQKVTVNWKFKSFNEFTQNLRKVFGINSQIINKAHDPLSLVWVNIENQPVYKLLDSTASRFGYNWAYKNNLVIFSAILPPVSMVDDGLVKGKLEQPSRHQLWLLDSRDKTLRSVLTKWCANAKWQLVWNVKADYPITNAWHITGTFEHAINEVLKASQSTEISLFATMHESNKVLEIHTQATK